MEKISVAVRVRPPTSEDSSGGAYWKVDGNSISLHKDLGSAISGLSYAFDHVFDERCTNASIYELLSKDIIQAAVEGFNGTAFAYGQTSSGKTYTMNGYESDPGIIPRGVKDIFEKIKVMSDREFLIRVSYMEIYNEEINDLFAVENQKLQIHENLERGVYVAGLREEIVNDAEQVLNLIRTGEVNRHFGETNMNVKSSRSHTIFRMVIESKGKEIIASDDHSSTDVVRISVLNLVDLAGSERIAKTGAGGIRLKEGKHINKSLMVLGNVINKLSDSTRQRGHVPYRDSKLTRILQPALGGNAKTSIICTVAPEEIHTEETKGTLQFASRAKHITNCVQVNEILTDTALLKRQKLEIEGLRKKLEGSHTVVLEQEILKLRNDLLKYEVDREKLELELQEEKKKWNAGNLDTNSEYDHSYSQGSQFGGLEKKCQHSDNKCQGDAFTTPCFKSAPDAFVVKRSFNHMMPYCSPISETFTNIVDEDAWLKMNNGHEFDLDFLQTTPATKVQSFRSTEKHPVFLNESSEPEIQNLQRQLELVILEKNELEKKHLELLGERSNFQQKTINLQETSYKLCESLKTCKDIFHDVLSTTQVLAPDRKSSSAKFISCTREICESIFTALEAHSVVAMGDQLHFKGSACLLQEENKLYRDRLKSAITTIIAEASTSSCNCSKIDKVSLLEDRRRKDLEDGVKQLILAFTHRQKALTSLSREVTSKVEKLRAQKPISQLNSLESKSSGIKLGSQKAALIVKARDRGEKYKKRN